jgi:hypothetical protein
MERKSRRSLRVAMVLGAAVAGTAMVGFGGLAAWNAYTENAGNSVAAGTLAHANYITASCVSNLGSVPVLNGTGWCSTGVINVPGVDPANFSTLVQPINIKIDNTGSLQSTFQLTMGTGSQAPTNNALCTDLTLTVKDKNGATIWNALQLNGGTFTAANLNNNATTPSLTWTGGGTAGTGTGATGNTFTVTVGMGGSFATDPADQGLTCTFGLLFTQTAA